MRGGRLGGLPHPLAPACDAGQRPGVVGGAGGGGRQRAERLTVAEATTEERAAMVVCMMTSWVILRTEKFQR